MFQHDTLSSYAPTCALLRLWRKLAERHSARVEEPPRLRDCRAEAVIRYDLAKYPFVQLLAELLEVELEALPRLHERLRRGQVGSALMGSLLISLFVDRETFWVLPLTYLYLPNSARAYLFPQYVKMYYLCSGPVSVDPICPHPRGP